jgi:hypothetical protein
MFPEDLKALYKTIVPVSEGFYDWSDDSPCNIRFLSQQLAEPIETGLCEVEYTEGASFWHKDWGEKPDDYDSRQRIAKEGLLAAPTLIPVYKCNYAPGIPGGDGYPIYDVPQLLEVIDAAEDIWDFFERVFAGKCRYGRPWFIKPTPFWSDVALTFD